MRFRSLAVVAALAPALVAAAPAPVAAAPSAEEAPQVKVPVKEGMLSNGMKILVVERPEIPTVACVVKFRVGAVDERPGITGIAHILEHMLFKGTDAWGTTDYEAEKPLLEKTERLYHEIVAARAALPIEIRRDTETYEAILRVSHTLAVKDATPASRRDEALERDVKALRDEAAPLRALGAGVAKVFDLEAEFCKVQEEAEHFVVDDEDWQILDRQGAWGLNASTGNDSTQYFYSLPANRLELWALIESGRMRNPVLRQFYKERDVIMEERRMRTDNNPTGRLFEQTTALAFNAHPYHWPVIGWASDIASISRTQTEQFFRRYYAPNRAIACIVGDVKFEQVKALMERWFGDIPRQPDPEPVQTVEPAQLGERRSTVKYDNLQVPMISVSYHRPALGHPDFYVLDVITGILTGGNSARLPREVFFKGGIGQCQAGNGDSLYPELFTFFGQPMVQNGKTLDDLEKAIAAQVQRLKDEPVSERELQRVRNQNYAQLVRNMESNMGLAQTISGYEVMFRWDYINTYQQRIEAVTPADIQRVAKKYFRDDNKSVVHLVPSTPSAE
jgi:predicted Zn-dependent peptidase